MQKQNHCKSLNLKVIMLALVKDAKTSPTTWNNPLSGENESNETFDCKLELAPVYTTEVLYRFGEMRKYHPH